MPKRFALLNVAKRLGLKCSLKMEDQDLEIAVGKYLTKKGWVKVDIPVIEENIVKIK